MPEIPNVVSGEPVIADWGNDIRDRVVQRFADATARTASLPFPQPGQLTWLTSPPQIDVWDGTQWRLVLSGSTVNVTHALGVGRDDITDGNAGPGEIYAKTLFSSDDAGVDGYPARVEPHLIQAPDFQLANSGTGVGAIKDGTGANRVILNDGADINLLGSDGVSRVDIRDDYATAVDAGSATGRAILIGTTAPDPSWGKDGDVYLRYVP